MDTAEVSALLQDVAERIILPRWQRLETGDVFDKGRGDLVTVADREAEIELTAELRRRHPGCLIVGEEAVVDDPTPLSDLATAPHAWVIDPVDGTANFARGTADFAVMVAELREGVTLRGWIWQPVHRRLCVAERGGGVTLNGVPVRPRPRGGELVGALQRGHPPLQRPGVRFVRSWGSCGIEYPALVEGVRDFLVYKTMKPWDHLPGALMVRELGGRVATVEGVDYAPGITGRSLVVAADVELWPRVAEWTLQR